MRKEPMPGTPILQSPENSVLRASSHSRARIPISPEILPSQGSLPLLHQLHDLGRFENTCAEQGPIYKGQFTAQNIAELWNAMTRPIVRNGLGLTVTDTDRLVQAIEAGMSLLPDNEAVYREWRRIVVQYNVSGVQVHDALLAAAMYVHHVDHLLTLNVADFSRFTGLTAVHPNTPLD